MLHRVLKPSNLSLSLLKVQGYVNYASLCESGLRRETHGKKTWFLSCCEFSISFQNLPAVSYFYCVLRSSIRETLILRHFEVFSCFRHYIWLFILYVSFPRINISVCYPFVLTSVPNGTFDCKQTVFHYKQTDLFFIIMKIKRAMSYTNVQ